MLVIFLFSTKNVIHSIMAEKSLHDSINDDSLLATSVATCKCKQILRILTLRACS